jgi:hypothetical protein
MPKSEEQTKDIRAFTHLQLQRNRPFGSTHLERWQSCLPKEELNKSKIHVQTS